MPKAIELLKQQHQTEEKHTEHLTSKNKEKKCHTSFQILQSHKIVQLLQLGILTGTDVTDQMRTLRLQIDADTNQLVPTAEYTAIFNENLERMQQQADEEPHA